MVILKDRDYRKIKIRFIEYTSRSFWDWLLGSKPFDILEEEESDFPYPFVIGTIVFLPSLELGKPYKIVQIKKEEVRVCK